MEYKEIIFRETLLRVYPTGEILKLFNISNQFGKKGDWVTCNKGLDSRGYYYTEIKGKSFRCHRLIGMVYLDLDIDNPKLQIDHINRIRTDNRVENLRIVTQQQNAFNCSNTKGYYFRKDRNKYRAYIRVNGILKHLGYFDTKEEAHERYLQEKAIMHII